VKKHGGQACPAERLNGKWYADNGLENLLVPKTGAASQILNQKPSMMSWPKCSHHRHLQECLNSFSYSLSERLLSAIQRGAAAWCIRNAMIDATFKDGEDALMLDAHGDKVGAQSFSPDARIEQFLGALAAVYEAPFENAGSNIRIFRLASYLRSESCNLLGGTGVWPAALLSPKALGISSAFNGASRLDSLPRAA
jgi:hypothetical protein